MSAGDAAIVDAMTGEVHLRPSTDVIAAYSDKVRFLARRQRQYRALRDVPAVTTDVGFVRDVVLQGETGWVVPTREPSALAAALREAAHDGGARGRAARQHCLDRFDSRRVTDVWLSLLRTVAR